MGGITEKITEFIKDLLTGWITSNLDTMFTDVNTKVETIATEVGKTPQNWNSGIFSMIKNLSDNVIVPIAGMIITFVLCYELISMIMEKNNMHDTDTFMFFKYIFKMWVAVYLVTHTFDIAMAIFDVANHVVSNAGGMITGSASIDVTEALKTLLETQIEDMGIGELLGLGLETMLVSLCLKIISVLITVILYGRMIEIYLYVSVAPIPYKTPVELNWYAYISTYYGYSVNNGTGQTQLHRGVTINVRQGTEVKSAMNGFVVDVGYSGTFGNYVVTQDKKGVQIKYAYLQSISVANGQEVTTDTVIGTTGSTGSATGSQLYLELVKDGEYYNPVFYISTGDSGLYVGGGSYDDETVRRLFAEADKYLGMPYVWGGSSPETSFDCSGFVSYVFTNSGVCNMGRLTAQGIYDICMPVSPEEARPGDIIFFTGTYDAGEPVTHVGIYAGDGQMIHCGNPIQYTSINSAYWQSHFYAFGRP